MKPTLFLLAAGMGSRYGGLKQLDGLGPNGETIMDYSIYDAIQAGFGKIVWVIRKDFEEQFRTQILSKYEGHIPCELCFQGLDSLPVHGFGDPADIHKGSSLQEPEDQGEQADSEQHKKKDSNHPEIRNLGKERIFGICLLHIIRCRQKISDQEEFRDAGDDQTVEDR